MRQNWFMLMTQEQAQAVEDIVTAARNVVNPSGKHYWIHQESFGPLEEALSRYEALQAKISVIECGA